MKTILAAATLIEVLVLLTVSVAQQPNPVADPDAQRILDKAAQAQGSDSSIGTLRTIRLSGSMYWGSSHLLGDVESIIKFPDKFRDSFRDADGNTLEYGFDGTEAWKRVSGEKTTGLPRLQLLLPAAQWRLRYTEGRFITYRVSRFQNIEGLKVPREWSFGENRTVLRSMKVNTDIDDKQFSKPK
jgi:hypothetical protein